MACRPNAELIRSCIQVLIERGHFVNSTDVADMLKESLPRYRRLKTSIVVKLIEPMVEAEYKSMIEEASKTSAKDAMNESLRRLYRLNSLKAEQNNDAIKADTVVDDIRALRKGSSEEAEDAECAAIKKRGKFKKETDVTEDFKAKRPRFDEEPRTSKREFFPEPLPDFSLDALGGFEKVIKTVRDIIIRPLKHREVYQYLGITPMSGVLLHGPPGSGKTKLALATAGEAGVPFFKISAPEIVSGISGESEGTLRSLFAAARAHAPSLVFIDELDAICPKRESASRDMERRIVAQLATCMDELAGAYVVVLGTTNRAEALDPMIRRNGRFDREIAMGIPDDIAREKILHVITKHLRLNSDVDLRIISKKTPGFVGADLEAIAKEAALLGIQRGFDLRDKAEETEFSSEELSQLSIAHGDFLHAIDAVQPSAKREGFATTPDVCWDDVGGLSEQRKELEDQICFPIRDFSLYKKLGLEVPAGILLFGPPGCGKTLLAKAVASESGANFISVKGPELLNKYVGESEKAIRQVFQRARMSAPCVIFFDELDSMCCRRGNEGGAVSERVVNQLLTEMDGVQDRQNVYVVAASNRPELIDPAMLRPGRLERLVSVPLPDEAKRKDILQRLSRRFPVASDLNYEELGRQTDGFSGADLTALLRRALMLVLEEFREGKNLGLHQFGSLTEAAATEDLRASMIHLRKALEYTTPSVSKDQVQHYAQKDSLKAVSMDHGLQYSSIYWETGHRTWITFFQPITHKFTWKLIDDKIRSLFGWTAPIAETAFIFHDDIHRIRNYKGDPHHFNTATISSKPTYSFHLMGSSDPLSN